MLLYDIIRCDMTCSAKLVQCCCIIFHYTVLYRIILRHQGRQGSYCTCGGKSTQCSRVQQYMYLHTEAWTASKYQSVKASKFQSSKASKSQSVKASKCQSHQSVKAAKSPSLTADLPQTQRERIELQTLNHAVIRAVLLLVEVFFARARAGCCRR